MSRVPIFDDWDRASSPRYRLSKDSDASEGDLNAGEKERGRDSGRGLEEEAGERGTGREFSDMFADLAGEELRGRGLVAPKGEELR